MMISLKDVMIVTAIAICATVLVGVLGYLIDKNSDPEGKAQRESAERKS